MAPIKVYIRTTFHSVTLSNGNFQVHLNIQTIDLLAVFKSKQRTSFVLDVQHKSNGI